MSLLSRLWRKVSGPGEAAGGQALEERGDFLAAASEYEREGLHDEAIRVLLILADADPSPPSRVRTLARVLRVASHQGDPPLHLRARYARARLDVVRGASVMPRWEVAALAAELESIEEYEAAAEAYGLVGMKADQIRMLAAGGQIERLEGVLDQEKQQSHDQQERSRLLADTSSLAAGGQRADAMRFLQAFCDAHPSDEQARSQLAALRARVVRPPSFRVQTGDKVTCHVLTREVIIGRAEATVVIPSPMLSRRHLRLWREGAGFRVEDLQTRNGTLLAGARLAGPVGVAPGMSLRLGGEVACSLDPRDGGLCLDTQGQTYFLPMAEVVPLGPWRVEARAEVLRLVVPPGAPLPWLNDAGAAGEGFDLCVGDEIRAERGGPVLFKVVS